MARRKAQGLTTEGKIPAAQKRVEETGAFEKLLHGAVCWICESPTDLVIDRSAILRRAQEDAHAAFFAQAACAS